MKLKDYGFIVTVDIVKQKESNLCNGVPNVNEFPSYIQMSHNGEVFVHLQENNDNLFGNFSRKVVDERSSVIKSYRITSTASTGFFIQKNKMYHREGRDKYILSNILLHMDYFSKMKERVLDPKTIQAFREFVEKYFEHVLGNRRSEEEAG